MNSIPNINLTVTEKQHRKFREAKARLYAKNWADMIETLIEGEGEIQTRIISIDGEDPKKHSMTIQLGDYIYKYDGLKDEFIMLESAQERKLKTIKNLALSKLVGVL